MRCVARYRCFGCLEYDGNQTLGWRRLATEFFLLLYVIYSPPCLLFQSCCETRNSSFLSMEHLCSYLLLFVGHTPFLPSVLEPPRALSSVPSPRYHLPEVALSTSVSASQRCFKKRRKSLKMKTSRCFGLDPTEA
jgi:hypothetical protein